MGSNTRTIPQLLFKVFIRPVFPFLQKTVQSLGLFKEAVTVEGPYRRQPYLIRMKREGETTEELAAKLAKVGFYDEQIALQEYGQERSMRRLCNKRPGHQYHVRIFSDGEIRGHFELTPEDNPLGHWKEEVFEDRKERLLSWLD